MVKTCKQCNQPKALTEFYFFVQKGNQYYNTRCIPCHLEYNKQRRQKTGHASSKKWYQQNKQAFSEYRKTWYEENRERILAQGLEYRHSLSGITKRKTNSAKRRTQLLNATPVWSNLNMIEQIYEQATQITFDTGIPHQVDHYYPLKGKTVCGLHVPSNLRIITKQENHQKNNKHPDIFYKRSTGY